MLASVSSGHPAVSGIAVCNEPSEKAPHQATLEAWGVLLWPPGAYREPRCQLMCFASSMTRQLLSSDCLKPAGSQPCSIDGRRFEPFEPSCRQMKSASCPKPSSDVGGPLMLSSEDIQPKVASVQDRATR